MVGLKCSKSDTVKFGTFFRLLLFQLHLLNLSFHSPSSFSTRTVSSNDSEHGTNATLLSRFNQEQPNTYVPVLELLDKLVDGEKLVPTVD